MQIIIGRIFSQMYAQCESSWIETIKNELNGK